MVTSLKTYSFEQKARKAATPQGVRTPGRTDEVRNASGGFVFKVSDRDRLERFLILGTDGPSYVAGKKTLVESSADFLRKMIRDNEPLVLDTVVAVSDEGRAYSNSPALFALALLMTDGEQKARTRAAVEKVARTSTHLFEFAQYIDNLGGWGRAKRAAVANWYESQDPGKLAYQAVKYRQRDGWTHRDLFRLSHPKGVDQRVGTFILKGASPTTVEGDILDGFAEMQRATSVKNVLGVLARYKNLPWETVPTQFLADPEVWKAIFRNGQLNGQALVRNITRLARNGAFKDMMFAAEYAARLTDEEMIRKSRLHPINYLNAAVVYAEGQMTREKDRYGYSAYGRRVKDWTSESTITDAINDGFHAAFKAVEPAGKRTMLAVDVSGSMGGLALGLDLSCAQVSGAMAMTIARTEPAHIIRGFTSGSGGRGGWSNYRSNTELTDLGISAKTPLATAMRSVQKSNFGGTDCAMPMVWALKNKVEVDTFVVITDNETWDGDIKPTQALKKYRDATGIPARLAVLGVASSDFTIADSTDRGQMDFCGFDSAAPRVLADFSAGRL